MSNVVGGVLLIIGILIGAGGYYLVTSGFAISHPSTSRSTTPIIQSSTVTTSEATCLASKPLTLSSEAVTTDSISGETLAGLSTVWSNCSIQYIMFNLSGSLIVTVSTYGTISHFSAYLGACVGSCGTVDGGASTTVSLPFYPQPQSPNSIIESISGNITATDPATGQAISLPTDFTT